MFFLDTLFINSHSILFCAWQGLQTGQFLSPFQWNPTLMPRLPFPGSILHISEWAHQRNNKEMAMYKASDFAARAEWRKELRKFAQSVSQLRASKCLFFDTRLPRRLHTCISAWLFRVIVVCSHWAFSTLVFPFPRHEESYLNPSIIRGTQNFCWPHSQLWEVRKIRFYAAFHYKIAFSLCTPQWGKCSQPLKRALFFRVYVT